MPSVGMRRTTRVFGVVKAADGARVLRSGRRLWPNSGEPKVRRTHDVDDRDWDSLLRDQGKGKGHKTTASYGGRSTTSSGRGSKPCSPKRDLTEINDKKDDFPAKKRGKLKNEAFGDGKGVDKMFGIVYRRKRKQFDDQTSNFSDKSKETSRSLKFYCRRRRISDRVSSTQRVLTVVVDRSCGNCWFSSVFGLVMRYMRREKLRLSALTSFFLSQPVNNVYSDHGVRFLLEPPVSLKGVCKFFGARNRLPLCSVDFAADPDFFMDMNNALLHRMVRHSYTFVKESIFILQHGETPQTEESNTDDELVILETCKSRNENVLAPHLSFRASRLTGGNAQYRSNVGSRSFQKRRSSLRRRRARNLSHGAHKLCNGALISDLRGSRKNGTTLSSAVSTRKLRSTLQNNLALESNEISSPIPGTKHELGTLCCSANLLIIDSDRCTREEGLVVMLEFSSSREWILVIKRDGSIRYSHKAQRIMRPCSCNRFTHSIIWTGDDNWKLEFCNRQDWFVFKDIYKECYERNALDPNVKVIPIPGTQEVSGFEEDIGDHPPFCRPVSYISMKEDEISRALARSSAIYDMDSEDEEWLKTYNQKITGKYKQYLQLSEDAFELMIDGFEKAYYQSPTDDGSDKKAVSSVSKLSEPEVVEATYSYWTRKRKQRKAPLLRVFQGHQVKKAPLITKPIFRKRRSFKRQASQLYGKASQPSPFYGLVKLAEQDALEEQNIAAVRAEEAKASAETTMAAAIAKRQRAQLLAENADLAIYKAMMALRITDAIRMAKSSEAAASLFLN